MIIHMTLSDGDPCFSGKSCCCNSICPETCWSFGPPINGCLAVLKLFPLAHVWHLGGGVLRRGGRTIGHTWEWVGAKRDEGGKEASEGESPFNDNTVSFCRMSLN